MMDEADLAYHASVKPDDGVSVGFIAVHAWLSEDGLMHWKVHNELDLPCTGVVGLLELAKLKIVSMSKTGITFCEYEDD